MTKKVHLSIHYENGTATFYDISSIAYISFGRQTALHYDDGLCVHHLICTLEEALQTVKRLGLGG